MPTTLPARNTRPGINHLLLGTLLILLLPTTALADTDTPNEGDDLATTGLFTMERRRDQYGKDFAYFVFPFTSKIPGYGTGYGGIGMAANVGGTDTDMLGFYMQGDFYAAGLTVLDMNLIPRRLIFDVALYDYEVAHDHYGRGIDSDPDTFIRPEVRGKGATGQLTLTAYHRMFDLYTRYSTASNKVQRVLDADGNEFTNTDQDTNTSRTASLGFTVDLTDDRLDPRRGVRLEGIHRRLLNESDPIYSRFNVNDLNLTLHFPVGRHSTWLFNAYRSDAVMESEGSTDRAELEQRFGLNCATIPDPTEQAICLETERQRIDEILAYNQYGNASFLGGTQRMRAYVNGRFHAGHAVSYGTEFRWNLTEEQTLMNWYILKGVRTNIQTAFFAEAGSVADHQGDLYDKMQYAYGAGLRIVFSGAVLRLDVATGSEGVQSQIFLNYPWSLFSVDNPQ